MDLAQAVPVPLAELDFYYGTALAHLGRWEDARKAFQAGQRLRPEDERFPVELAGVAFKEKRYPEAAAYLRLALKFAPDDSYANDFLGTVYFLQSNLEAALKCWNRAQLEKRVPDDPKHRTYGELLVESLFAAGIRGNLRAVVEITDRLEGKATQPVQLTGNEGVALNFKLNVHFRDGLAACQRDAAGEARARCQRGRDFSIVKKFARNCHQPPCSILFREKRARGLRATEVT